MAERQMSADLEGIRRDHVARYEWAKHKVSGRILDVACGCGYGSWILGENVTGVDRSEDAIAFAIEHWAGRGAKFHVGDAAATHRGFDWVVSFETIEHVDDHKRLLRAFHGAAPRMVGSVPNQDGLPFTKERFPYHVRHYTGPELEYLLYQTGWRLVGLWGQKGPYSPVGAMERDARTLVFEAERA